MFQIDVTLIVFAVPLIGWLFAWFFKMDELVSRTQDSTYRGRRLESGVDASGAPVCTDPDRRVFVPLRRRNKQSAGTRLGLAKPSTHEIKQTLDGILIQPSSKLSSSDDSGVMPENAREGLCVTEFKEG